MRCQRSWLTQSVRPAACCLLSAALAVPAAAQVVAPPVIPPTEVEVEDSSEVGTPESTILEGAGDLRSGTGDLRRDTGAAALYGSMAAVNLQEAVEEYLKNQVQRVETYREVRKQWEDARAERRRQPLTEEGYRRIALERAPDRLGEESFNPDTGEILWPPPLDAQQLADHRKAIEQQFARRAASGHQWTAADYHQVNAHVQVMIRAVRAVEELLSPNEFAALLQMLEKIEWEAQHDAEGKRLALLGGGAAAAAERQQTASAEPAAGQSAQRPAAATRSSRSNEPSAPVVPEPPQPAPAPPAQPE